MFIDTSIIIDILTHKQSSDQFKKIFSFIKDEPLYISVIQLGELSDWCFKNNVEVNKCLPKIKKMVSIILLDETICLHGSKLKHTARKQGNKKFSLIDGLILASATSVDEKLLTKDTDFINSSQAIVLF
ncbi:MAG: PIN domain-containing protein [Candidatus Thermoplasmatota archaeon]|nr:PIN domain-containing protein [Candidatus Thermoplasmatota archaeon]